MKKVLQRKLKELQDQETATTLFLANLTKESRTAFDLQFKTRHDLIGRLMEIENGYLKIIKLKIIQVNVQLAQFN